MYRLFYTAKVAFACLGIYINNYINRGHEFERHQEDTWEQLGKRNGIRRLYNYNLISRNKCFIFKKRYERAI